MGVYLFYFVLNVSEWLPFAFIQGFERPYTSPFLFTLVVEVLGTLLSKAKELVLVGGFEVGRQGLAVTYLQFADDTILFSSSKVGGVSYAQKNLEMFPDVVRFKD